MEAEVLSAGGARPRLLLRWAGASGARGVCDGRGGERRGRSRVVEGRAASGPGLPWQPARAWGCGLRGGSLFCLGAPRGRKLSSGAFPQGLPGKYGSRTCFLGTERRLCVPLFTSVRKAFPPRIHPKNGPTHTSWRTLFCCICRPLSAPLEHWLFGAGWGIG